jgi:Holliday junction resolvase
MAQTPEGRVKAKVKAILDKHGAWYFLPAQNGYGRAGIPDIIVCYKGRFLAIECKAGYNKPTALQEREILAIHKAGGSAMVVREDTLDQLERWFI